MNRILQLESEILTLLLCVLSPELMQSKIFCRPPVTLISFPIVVLGANPLVVSLMPGTGWNLTLLGGGVLVMLVLVGMVVVEMVVVEMVVGVVVLGLNVGFFV